MPTRKPLVPPGGFAGWSQQTAATQALLQPKRRTRRKKTRRKTARKKTATRRSPARRTSTTRRSTARKKKPARLVKGSAAAKRHMAKLRAMRGKRK